MTDLAFPKPGKKQKPAKILNKKSRVHDIEKPKDTYCRFCGEPDDGTCYYHHCEVPYLKLKYGSGTSVKIDDNLSVWAHHKCGTEMSKQPIMDGNVCDFLSHYEYVTHEYLIEWESIWYLAIIESHLV